MGYYEMVIYGGIIVAIPILIIGFVSEYRNRKDEKEQAETQIPAQTKLA